MASVVKTRNTPPHNHAAGIARAAPSPCASTSDEAPLANVNPTTLQAADTSAKTTPAER